MIFDALIFVGILAALGLSRQPKQTAILVCIFVSLAGFIVNEFSSAVFMSLGLVEFCAVYVLATLSAGVQSPKERRFFYLMGGFLLASASLNVIFIPVYKYTEFLSFELYTQGYRGIAVAHTLTMLALSDGIRTFTRGIINTMLSAHLHVFNARS